MQEAFDLLVRNNLAPGLLLEAYRAAKEAI